jgi:hypothetical protein
MASSRRSPIAWRALAAGAADLSSLCASWYVNIEGQRAGPPGLLGAGIALHVGARRDGGGSPEAMKRLHRTVIGRRRAPVMTTKPIESPKVRQAPNDGDDIRHPRWADHTLTRDPSCNALAYSHRRQPSAQSASRPVTALASGMEVVMCLPVRSNEAKRSRTCVSIPPPAPKVFKGLTLALVKRWGAEAGSRTRRG